MDNVGMLVNQAAAEAKCSPNAVKVALYLSQLSQQGKSFDYACSALQRDRNTIKKYCREFLIDFPDYRPFARMEKKGKERPEPKYKIRLTDAQSVEA